VCAWDAKRTLECLIRGPFSPVRTASKSTTKNPAIRKYSFRFIGDDPECRAQCCGGFGLGARTSDDTLFPAAARAGRLGPAYDIAERDSDISGSLRYGPS
jgi:hypothetical protein